VIDGLNRFLKFGRGLRLFLEIAVMFVASDDSWGYGFRIPALDAEIIFNVEGAKCVLGICLPFWHS